MPMGRVVLEHACRKASEWRRRWPTLPPIDVSVNLSSRQFRDPALLDTIRATLAAADLPATSLILEITESAMLDADASDLLMRRLRDLGVRLAVDDFGTGFSGLSYFQRFPLDALKIDRSFVSGLGQDPRSGAIVHATIAFAKALGLTVTAEGIETEDQLERLRTLGADLGQGYLFATPAGHGGRRRLPRGRPGARRPPDERRETGHRESDVPLARDRTPQIGSVTGHRRRSMASTRTGRQAPIAMVTILALVVVAACTSTGTGGSAAPAGSDAGSSPAAAASAASSEWRVHPRRLRLRRGWHR